MSELATPATPLPPPQGYVAEKVSMLMGALRTAFRRVGLVVQTADDSVSAAPQHRSSVTAADVPSNASSPTPRTYSGGIDHLGWFKVPGVHTMGEPIERALHDAAEYHNSKAVQVAHDALVDTSWVGIVSAEQARRTRQHST